MGFADALSTSAHSSLCMRKAADYAGRQLCLLERSPYTNGSGKRVVISKTLSLQPTCLWQRGKWLVPSDKETLSPPLPHSYIYTFPSQGHRVLSLRTYYIILSPFIVNLVDQPFAR